MTRKDLEDLRPLKAEIESIKEEIHHLKITTDSVTGSLSEHPWTEQHIKIQGVDQSQYVRLMTKLNIKIDERQGRIAKIEEWLDKLDDTEMRTILRMYYCDGKTQEEIGRKMGYNRSTIAKKIERFFKFG